MNIKLQKSAPALPPTPMLLTLSALQGVDSSKGEEGRTDKLPSGCKPSAAKPGTCRHATHVECLMAGQASLPGEQHRAPLRGGEAAFQTLIPSWHLRLLWPLELLFPLSLTG